MSISVMADNVLQTLQQLIQDVIAPDVRELKVRVSSLEKQMDVRFEAVEQRMDVRFDAVDRRFETIEQRMDAQFKAIMATIGEPKAQAELSNARVIAALSERVAVLEARSH